jgi:hypothetical protein
MGGFVKRSEAIEKIADEMRYRDACSVEDIAEDILKVLEEAGMLPPRTMLYPLKLEDNAWEQE